MSDPSATGAFDPTPTPAGERFPPGAVLAGRYRVVAQLGRGGMGEVYRADDLTLGQAVALKFLPAHLATHPDRLTRFRKEVATARRVSHPNVCRVYDFGEHDGHAFLTMEFVAGEDLAALLQKVGRLPEERGVELARQLCAALGAVHDQGLLHRDLKPANVLLDGRGRVRLADFGLAATAADLSAEEVRSGTPMYQAPEQRAGREVTARSDLYALGLVLYELFTGKRPFPGANREAAPGRPSSHVTGLDPAVERVILRCLEPDPVNRPRSAYEVLAGLPGGDPLAAAVAAGETPSPKMVADAPVEGTLRPAVAATLFGGSVLLVLLIAGLNDQFKAYREVPLPRPGDLEYQAKAMVREFGYADPPGDSAGGYGNDLDALRPLHGPSGRRLPDGERNHLAAARPALVVYWYRQGPQFLGTVRYEGRVAHGRRQRTLSATNPPNDVPGMVGVVLDTSGRLVRLTAVPDPEATPPPQPVGWAVLLKAAGLDGPGVLREVSDATPTLPVFADRTAAWEGAYPDRPDVRVRVEAGSYRGRPVSFRIIHPNRAAGPSAAGDTRVHANPSQDLFAALFSLISFGVLVVFAVRNFRRADVRGAALLGGAVFAINMAEWALAGRHLAYVGTGFIRLMQVLEQAVLQGALLGAFYLALEPVVRRRYPHRLTAWTRLLAGRWRDPLVGRDVLIGVAAGLLVSADLPLSPFLSSWDGPVVVNPYTFAAPGRAVLNTAEGAVQITWFYSSVGAVVLAVSRRDWVAMTVLVGLVTLLVVPWAGGEARQITMDLVRVLTAAVLFARFGVLAMAAWFAAYLTVVECPLTLDTAAWYFEASLTYLLVLTGLAGYGAVVAAGGRRMFRSGDAG